MPYPHEHSCRLHHPGEFVPGSFRSMRRWHGSKPYRVILGKLRGHGGAADPLVEQAYRYPVDAWTEGEATAHCNEHGGRLFEPALLQKRAL